MFDMTNLEIATHSAVTMLWQAGEMFDENGELTVTNWDDHYLPEDATEDATDRMVSAIRKFVSRVRPADLATYLDQYSPTDLIHDYWLTRNGHGVGFWDRGLGPVGDRLIDLSYVGTYDLFQVDEHTWSWE